MRKFMLQTIISEFPFRIGYEDDILLLGSCFSDDIGAKFSYFGFNSLSNPHGTIFHPDVIARNILEGLSGQMKVRQVERDGILLSYNAGSQIYGTDSEQLIERLNERNELLKKYLNSSKVIFITFGTAWGYIEKESAEVVANCHKVPSQNFEKRLSSVEEMEKNWLETIDKIKKVNPSVKIVLTVSPVRHSKEGLVENNRSKARLIELAYRLSGNDDIFYFPSYEILIDELRDYRFYKKDLVHPSAQAIEIIWERLIEHILDEKHANLLELIGQYRSMCEHDLLHPESSSASSFEKRKADLKEKIMSSGIEIK
ncbi:MAG: GSCFA domain-containing protein [Bacteroidetes bacterium]|nr:MAG: GSCFA domain-containing protein [Bacteroidota bacterium]